MGGAGETYLCVGSPRNTAWFQEHPVLAVQESPNRCIPIGIYGDDAGVFNNAKILMLLWGGTVEKSRMCLLQCNILR